MDTALENSVWVTSPEFAGWLVKRGFRWRKLWTKRWVALHGTEIAYMAEEPNDKSSKDMVVTKCQIVPGTIINREDIEGHPHGFAIHINDGTTPVWYLRAESTREKKSWLMRLGHVQEIVKWLDNFEKVKVLGVGATGIVYELKNKTTGKRWALKEMEIKNTAQMQMALAEAEMLKEIMENISHPNIMHIEKVFQVGLKFYLVFPLCTGGELYEHVIRRGHFSEQDAAVIMHDLASGLLALHERDILHLDIKPENILFENDDDDSRIKITDFGLSKVFNPQEKEQSLRRNVSVDDMAKKLKNFQESGVLQRDRLRGTVGYMSPELILAGVSSAATDVWAAGVVLYILLCGHPPFQSKSNREILERSARGQFSLEGKEWESVSESAKDLVRKMLTVDPEKRITVANILQHPWIIAVSGGSSGQPVNPSIAAPPSIPTPTGGDQAVSFPAPLPPPATISLDAAAVASSSSLANAPPPVPLRNVHLGIALNALSSHVKDLKMEKMAVSFTRLVSTLQSDNKQQDKRRMIDTLLDKDGNALGQFEPEQNNPEAGLYVLNQDYKDAVAVAFGAVGTVDGKLTSDQFISIMNQFAFDGAETEHAGGSGASSAGAMFSGIPGLIIARFVDRDGDGLISAEDVFTAQALVIQRSEIFLRVVFRLYVESVWYPGRQINIINLQLQSRGTGRSASSNSLLTDQRADSSILEPPKFITGKHVAAVFERVGLDPAGGIQVFNALCEALKRRENVFKDAMLHDGASTSDIFDEESTGGKNAALAAAVHEEDTPKIGDLRINSLYSGVSSEELSGRDTSTSVQARPLTDEFEEGAGEDTEGVEYKMDFEDFAKVVQQIDDVLVSALQRRPRTKMAKLLKEVELRAPQGNGKAVDVEQLANEMKTKFEGVLSRDPKGSVSASTPEYNRSSSGLLDVSSPFVLASSLGTFVLSHLSKSFCMFSLF